MSKDCPLCNHHLRDHIDTIIQDAEESVWDQDGANSVTSLVNAFLIESYGDAVKQFDTATVKSHAVNHELITIDSPIVINEENGTVVAGQRVYTMPTFKNTLYAIIAVGLQNIQLRPSDVKPTHIIQALTLLAKAGINTDDAELEDIIRQKLADPAQIDPDAPMVPPDARSSG